MDGGSLRHAGKKGASASQCESDRRPARVRGYDSLCRRADFSRVARRGQRRSGRHLSCLVLDGRDRTRVGVTVSAQVGGAVVRNRLRRRIRSILDSYAFDQRPARDIVFIARPGAGELSFAELMSEVERTLGLPP